MGRVRDNALLSGRSYLTLRQDVRDCVPCCWEIQMLCTGIPIDGSLVYRDVGVSKVGIEV